jgi:hypothetical protein
MSQSAMYSKTNDDVAFELKEERERNVSHAKKKYLHKNQKT